MAVARLVGARIQRREDPRLITGHGRYVDDVKQDAALHMAVVRSPYAHAAIRRLEATAARALPGAEAAAFSEAEVVVKQRILQQRLAPMPMEGRAVLAEFDPYDGRLTVSTSSQVPHFIRLFLAGALGLPEGDVRVIAPDVGGAFGSKLRPYPEEYLAAAAAKLSGRP